MQELLKEVQSKHLKKRLPDCRIGDTVRVMVKVKVKVKITKTVQDEKTNNHTAIIIVIEPDSPYAGLEDKAR